MLPNGAGLIHRANAPFPLRKRWGGCAALFHRDGLPFFGSGRCHPIDLVLEGEATFFHLFQYALASGSIVAFDMLDFRGEGVEFVKGLGKVRIALLQDVHAGRELGEFLFQILVFGLHVALLPVAWARDQA